MDRHIMQLPSYWLSRPAMQLDSAVQQAFDNLYQEFVAHPPSQPIAYTFSAPKWQFLCYLAEQHNLALHGSGNSDITLFEPRQPVDISSFGNQNAVYAAADGIWAMFFAIVDRERHPMTVNNSCIHIATSPDQITTPYYFFSISQKMLQISPWREGTVYLLPCTSFVPEPPMMVEGVEIRSAQLASVVPVKPLARLGVTPDDFPFLKQIRGHDDERLEEYARALQTGAPLPDTL
jgi:hypothetical protein